MAEDSALFWQRSFLLFRMLYCAGDEASGGKSFNVIGYSSKRIFVIYAEIISATALDC